MKTRTNRSFSSATSTLLAACALTAAPALGQVYQEVDLTPFAVGGGANPPTYLEAVAPTADGGYIAVGREGMTIIHLARYSSAGVVLWSEYLPTGFFAEATSINQLTFGAMPTYVVAGEIADALPFGTWTMVIDGGGIVVCPMREINGVGPLAPAGRSPVAAKGLADSSWVVTGRVQMAAGGLVLGRLTRFAPGCGPILWSMQYTITGGTAGLTGACEITDVVEEPTTLLAVGTADLFGGGAVPFLLRVATATGAVVAAEIYAPGDPGMNIRGDGIALSYGPTGAIDGRVFDGRSTPVAGGAAAPRSNYVVKVGPGLGLGVLWAETFPEFEPCHACVRAFGSSTLLAGTLNMPGVPQADIWGELVGSGGGVPIWGWNYGHGVERGNGVAITSAAPGSPVGPIIVGADGITPSGYLVKSAIVGGSSGGCEVPAPPPFPGGGYWPATFAATPLQYYRYVGGGLLPEFLPTMNACLPPCCNVDYDNDGNVGTDFDIEAFFACLAGNCCATCPPNSDFNCDGDMGTDADIDAFFRVLAGGPC
jgi:hypothetical protein